MVMISPSVAEPMDPMIPRFGGLRLSGESSWSVVPPTDPEIQRFGGLELTVEQSESVMPPLLMDEPKEKRKMQACVDAKVHPESLRTTLMFPVVFPVADPEIKLSGGDEAKSRVEEKLRKLKAGGGQADAGLALAQRRGLASVEGSDAASGESCPLGKESGLLGGDSGLLVEAELSMGVAGAFSGGSGLFVE
nr:uncharacterized protein LOC109160698 isoform X1 [Ipomoea batatas]